MLTYRVMACVTVKRKMLDQTVPFNEETKAREKKKRKRW
jgi:hypothetical protein